MNAPAWDFDYRPISNVPVDESPLLEDMIVATATDVDPARLGELLGSVAREVEIRTVLSCHPLFWTQIRVPRPIDRSDCAERLRAGGVAVRYVASTRFGSQQPAPPLELGGALPRLATRWTARAPHFYTERVTVGRWYLGEQGVQVRRDVCGTGAGTRLAVIDDDAAQVEQLDLDRLVPVCVDRPLRGSAHGACLVAWAVRAAPTASQTSGFVGVAPNASPRLYLLPKPGQQVLALPLAIARAVSDGADVILCATNVEGQMSPMLDDALELAARLGRGSLGTAVVMPCGREASSPEGRVHSSFSLGAGEPASDPRVWCVGPSGRDGGWFVWSDRRGRLHPFANRGPALRWLAPGDDIAHPFCSPERLAHAESSGAAAIAAGVLLLVLGSNPELGLAELDNVLCRTISEVAPNGNTNGAALANPRDAMPSGRDHDGHNAKHGYGRLNAARACLAVTDPVAAALVSMGEAGAAQAWLEARRSRRALGLLYSARLARWSARAVLQNRNLLHAVCALARTLRLVGRDIARLEAQYEGAFLRELVVLLRTLVTASQAAKPAPELTEELLALVGHASYACADPRIRQSFNGKIRRLALALWPQATASSGEFPCSSLDQRENRERLRA